MAVYLIHFAQPYWHARHYIGYTPNADVTKRIDLHRKSRGARLLQVLNSKGLKWDLVRVWPEGDRQLERQLKDRKKASALCPVCRQAAGLESLTTKLDHILFEQPPAITVS